MKPAIFPILMLCSLTLLACAASGNVLSIESTEVTVIGGTASVELVLDEAPAGLSGYSINATFEDPTIGTVTGVSYPPWASMYETSLLPSSDCKVRAMDMGEQVQPGATNITLATLTLEALRSGSTTVNLTVNMMNDDEDADIAPAIVPGTFYVNVPGAPHAEFTSDVRSGPAPLTVQFTDQSAGNTPITFAWDFDHDGITDSTDQNPVFTYPLRGTYTVNLTVTNSIGTSTMVKPGYITATGARIWTVGASGCDFTTVHDAVGNPLMESGDTVFVKGGTYTTNESASASQDVSFTLAGEGQDAVTWIRSGAVALNGPGTMVEGITLVVPSGLGNDAITFEGSGSILRDCIFEGGGATLVKVSAPDVMVERNIFRDAWLGTSSNAVYIDSTSSCTVRSNTFSNLSMGDAVRVNKAGSNTIENNTFSSVFYGVRLNQQDTTGNLIMRNTFSACDPAGAAILFNSAGSDTTIFMNDFTGNGQDIRYSGTAPPGTSFISPAPVSYSYKGTPHTAVLGNHWDTYQGIDADGDGIGDSPMQVRTTEPLDADPAPLMEEVRYYSGEIPTAKAPVAAFTASPTNGTSPLSVQFTDQSTNAPTSWSWTFGDGGTSAEQHPVHIYNSHGVYSVNLTVTNAGGSDSEVKTGYITVTETGPDAPVATFTASPTNGTAPLSVQFTDQSTNAPTSWSWTFGDGGTSDQENPSHTFSSVGVYVVTLTVTNPSGSDSEIVYIYAASESTISLSPSSVLMSPGETRNITLMADEFTHGMSGYVLTATVSESSVAEISGVSFPEWASLDNLTGVPSASARLSIVDIGHQVEPGAGETILATITLKAKDTGTATLSLGEIEVDDDAGNMVICTAGNTSIIVQSLQGDPPVAAFTATPTEGIAPLSVQFADQSTGSPTSWLWTFGDGNSTTGPNPAHTYTSPGTYTVSLTATNPDGSDSEVKTGYITVTEVLPEPPVSEFIASPTEGTAPLSVQFTDQSAGSPTGWSWSFGDGGTSAEQNPSHSYASEGTFTVTLTVENTGGSDSEVKEGYINVIEPLPEPPAADFSADPRSGTAPLSVQFTDESTGSPAGWLWSFGDGGTSAEQNPSHTFSGEGTYSVSLTVTNAGGTDTMTREDYITVTSEGSLLTADFSATPRSGRSPLMVRFRDRSSGNITSWAWDFNNDGSVDSRVRNPTWFYRKTGIYTVRLAVSGPEGTDEEIREAYISVNDRTKMPAIARFTQDKTVGIAPATVQFADLSIYYPDTYLWDFGDGTTSTEKNPGHTYSVPGTYKVHLQVSNANGASSATGFVLVRDTSTFHVAVSSGRGNLK